MARPLTTNQHSGSRLRQTILSLGERKTWTPPPLVRSEIWLGVALFALIVAIVVFGSAESYRFFYGPQF